MDPSGKVALIAGGARMGEAVALALARRGAFVALAWRSSRASAEAAAEAVRGIGGRAATMRADLAEEGAAPDLVAKASAAFDGAPLAILVSMASRYGRSEEPVPSLAAEWDAAFAIDARANWLLADAAARAMKSTGGGRIVLFADWTAASGRPRRPGAPAYHAAKAATIGMVEALALEHAPSVLVNAIAPGPILPRDDDSAETIAAAAKAAPLGRWGGAEEIAKAVLFLCETDYVAGECIRVDGGRHLV